MSLIYRCLIVLFFLTTPVFAADPPTPTADPLLCLPISNQTKARTKCGTCIPVGEHTVLASGHVVCIDSDSMFNFFLETPIQTIKVCDTPARVEVPAFSDDTAWVIHTDNKLGRWLNVGRATTGTAYVVRDSANIPITIVDLERRKYTDWRPQQGNSGSGIIQWIDNEWKIIGIVQAKYCDSCSKCDWRKDPKLWNCHCTIAGFYSAVPKHAGK